MIPQNCVGLIVGESRAGKTFLAVELSVAVSEGRQFFEKLPHKSGVLYIASEGEFTLPGRLHGARRGSKPMGNRVVVMPDVQDLNDPEVLGKVIEEAVNLNQHLVDTGFDPIGLVVIDTVISAFPLSNWNDASEVAEMFRCMRQIQKALNAAVVGVHHHGKNTARGAAGSHFLMGGPDCVLEVYRTANDNVVSDRWFNVSKNRFGEESGDFHFELLELAPDARDGNISVVFVNPCASDSGKKGTGTKGKQLAASHECFVKSFEVVLAAEGLIVDHPEQGNVVRARESTVKSKFEEKYAPKGKKPEEATRGAWRRALEDCETLGIVSEGEWLFRKADTPKT
jgi:hypothetical protein